MIKHLLEEILEETKNKGYHYFIECEGNVLQDITNDPELCHATRDDEYGGVNATDSSDIFILKYDKDLPEDDPLKRKPNIDFAKKELNWEPTVNINEGLDKTIKYFKEFFNGI